MVNSAQFTSNITDISSQFNIVKPINTPFLTMIMNATTKAKDTTHFFQSQVLSAAFDLCGAGATNVATSIVVSGTARHYVGEVITVDGTGEQILVGAVSGTNPSITLGTLTRGYNSTTAATIPANTKVRIISRGTVEGEEGTADNIELSTRLTNYCQIFRKRGSFSGSLLSVESVTMENDITKQTENFIAQIKTEIEQASIYGTPKSGSPRQMGGINSFLPSTNIQAVAGALTLPILDNAIGTLYNIGGQPDTILLSTKQYNVFQALAKTQRLFVTPETVDYKNYFESYSSAFSPVKMKVLATPHVSDSEVFVLDSTKIRVIPMNDRQLQYKELAVTGDNVPFHVLSEVTLEFEAASASGWRLTGLT